MSGLPSRVGSLDISGIKDHSKIEGDEDKMIELKIKDNQITRLRSFIFNQDILELLDDVLAIQEEMFRKEKERFRLQMSEPHTASFSTNFSAEKKSPNQSDFGTDFGVKQRISEIDDSIEMLRAKKGALEGELFKIENIERKKYDSMFILEKQNF